MLKQALNFYPILCNFLAISGAIDATKPRIRGGGGGVDDAALAERSVDAQIDESMPPLAYVKITQAINNSLGDVPFEAEDPVRRIAGLGEYPVQRQRELYDIIEGYFCEGSETAKGKGWHPHKSGEHICTNDNEYPRMWDEQSLFGKVMFETSELCCATIGNGAQCEARDVCVERASIACEDRHWHMSTTDGSSCTNDSDYPPSWDNPLLRGIVTFQSIEECCVYFSGTVPVGSDIACNVIEACKTVSPTSSPTSAPTSHPTFSPTSSPTVAPTSSPTVSPVRSPTVSPTHSPTVHPCMLALWHRHNGGCSNGDEVVGDSFLFAKVEDCCRTYFGSEHCIIYDDCRATSTPSQYPTLTPTRRLTVERQGLSCLERNYHPSPNWETCTNDINYPSTWDSEPLMSTFLFDSPQGCCEAFSSGPDCVIEDVCDGAVQVPSNAPTGLEDCLQRKWYPKGTLSNECTNDGKYPPAWDEPHLSTILLHDTAEQCCDAHSAPDDCVATDICSAVYVSPTKNPSSVPTLTPTDSPSMLPTYGPSGALLRSPANAQTKSALASSGASEPGSNCPDNKWHMSTVPGALSTCTNDEEYPPSWNNPYESQYFLFDGPDACCTNVYPGGSCNVVDSCAPSCIDDWHPSDENPGACTNSGTYPEEWGTPLLREHFFFPSAHECCSKIYSILDCDILDACTNDKAKTRLSKWYPDEGVCVFGNDYPDYMTNGDNFLFDWELECCHARDFCNTSVAADADITVFNLTEQPSEQATPIPSSNPTINSPTSSDDVDDSCRDRKWHPKRVDEQVCSNNSEYPPSWNNPQMSAEYLLDSSAECCARFYGDNCDVEDICSS